jgi:hypothetical protein
MASLHTKAGALLVAGGIMFTASPSFAQRNGERRGDNRGRQEQRAQPRRDWDGRRDSRNDRRFDRRSYGNRDYRPYVYRPYTRRYYAAPYGYRPYGYRPGWSLNLYFGRPYLGYYGYPDSGYGYYALAPGHLYGAVRIVDAPRDAQVFVDGYYAGVVDNYDGVFQHLNLEAGPHHIEIEDPGYLRLASMSTSSRARR